MSTCIPCTKKPIIIRIPWIMTGGYALPVAVSTLFMLFSQLFFFFRIGGEGEGTHTRLVFSRIEHQFWTKQWSAICSPCSFPFGAACFSGSWSTCRDLLLARTCFVTPVCCVCLPLSSIRKPLKRSALQVAVVLLSKLLHLKTKNSRVRSW